MKIYLAAKFSRAAEMRDVATELTLAGHQVVSRWYGFSASRQLTDDEQRVMATLDVHDIRAADLLLAFTEKPGAGQDASSGGRHVEFGFALALGKKLWIVGPRENIFYHLHHVRQFTSLDNVLGVLQAREARA